MLIYFLRKNMSWWIIDLPSPPPPLIFDKWSSRSFASILFFCLLYDSGLWWIQFALKYIKIIHRNKRSRRINVTLCTFYFPCLWDTFLLMCFNTKITFRNCHLGIICSGWLTHWPETFVNVFMLCVRLKIKSHIKLSTR